MDRQEVDGAGKGTHDAPGGGLIFVSDASAEAERLTIALRSRGYPTVDVPLGLLTARVGVQRPALIICDADAPGVLDVVEAVGATEGPEMCVVFLGDPDGSISTDTEHVRRHAHAVFTRPVEVYTLLRKVEALIGAPPEGIEGGSMLPPARAPVLVAAARKPYMVDASHADDRPSTGSARPIVPSSLPPGEDWGHEREPQERQLSLLPEASEPVGSSAPESHMSSELASLLAEAEQRLEDRPFRDLRKRRLSPEAEIDAVLPPDILASLDEPLDDDDDFEQDVAPGTKSGSEAGRTSPGSQSQASVVDKTDDPQSRATNPGGTLPRAPDSAENKTFSKPELPPTDPPPTPSVAPPTPAPRSLGTQGAITSVGAHADSDPVRSATGTAATARRPLSDAPGPQPVPTSRPPAFSDRPNWQHDREPNAGAQPRPARPERLPLTPALASLPKPIGPGTPTSDIASVITERLTGALVFEDGQGIRRIVFREGDFVTASSGVEAESLVSFLTQRGDLDADAASQLAKRLPAFGRHAGAALIANGHLKQDELWSVLRAHAEWLIGHLFRLRAGQLDWETEIPDRLRSEPSVFGGSTGAEVFVETQRRVLDPELALMKLGGKSAQLAPGKHFDLLGECALAPSEAELIRRAGQLTVDDFETTGNRDFPSICMALVELGVLSLGGAVKAAVDHPPAERDDPLDDRAVRARILARYALVEQGDYFALLGVSRSATDYEIRKAHASLTQEFLPSRVLTARNADLREKVETILEVLDEANDVLGDKIRRERYRRALDAMPG